MVRLIIKGNAYEARKALDKHKLQTITALDDQTFGKYGHTIAEVHITDLEDVLAWFCEEAQRGGTPHWPFGSLLHYQVVLP